MAPRRGDVPPGASRGCVSRGPQPHTEVTGSPQSHPCQETHPSNGKRPQDVLHPPARPPPPPPLPSPLSAALQHRAMSPERVTAAGDNPTHGTASTAPPPGPHPPPPPAACQEFAPPIAPQMSAVPPDCPRVEPRRRWGEGDPQRPPPPPPRRNAAPLWGGGAPGFPWDPQRRGGGVAPQEGHCVPPLQGKGFAPKGGLLTAGLRGAFPPQGWYYRPIIAPTPGGC